MLTVQLSDLDNKIKRTIRDIVDNLIFTVHSNGVLWANRENTLNEILTNEVVDELNKKVISYYRIFDNDVTSALTKQDYIEISMKRI